MSARGLEAQSGVTTVDPLELTCVIGGVTFSTPLDCAITRAKQMGVTTGRPQVLALSAGVYFTNIGFQFGLGDQPILLHGPGASAFGGGAVIKATAVIPTAMYYLPYLPTSPYQLYWSDISIEGVSFDGNNLANMCWDLSSIRTSVLSNLTCTGATSPQTWARVGSLLAQFGGPVPNGFDGQSFQVHMSDIFIFHNATAATNGAGSGALVSSKLNGDGTVGYNIQDPGLYRRLEGGKTVPGIVTGITCASMPIWIGNLTPVDTRIGTYTLASVTTISPGAGCRGTPNLFFPDIANTLYGMQIYATDSYADDVTINAVGTVAGMDTRGSYVMVFNKYHAVNVPDGADLWGGETFNNPEMDLIYRYGFNFRYSSPEEPISINNLYSVVNPGQAYANMQTYYYPDGVRNVAVDGQRCINGSVSGGCQEFDSTLGSLSVSALTLNGAFLLPVSPNTIYATAIIYPNSPPTPYGIFPVGVSTDTIYAINVPPQMSSTVGGCIKLRADTAWKWDVSANNPGRGNGTAAGSGNIVNAGAATVGRVYEACYGGGPNGMWTIN